MASEEEHLGMVSYKNPVECIEVGCSQEISSDRSGAFFIHVLKAIRNQVIESLQPGN